MEEEDVKHVYLDCTFTQKSWALSDLSWQPVSTWQENIGEWMRKVCCKLDQEEGNKFLAIWGLWNNQNKVLMENKCKNVSELVIDTVRFLNEFKCKKDCLTTKPNSSLPREWLEPAESYVKINHDGTIFEEEHVASTGLIA
ncbi:hypothetical protein Salat_1095600 [Sesamum alatum]|uniref:Uncharacterized protein n=1 Tax=Sesamum alatum TaxID=300844 RepID=A0AAE1YPF0_9LAMI|nr:hypothetical protein Salat_1095600 [Sesamum alatum]